jgi:hypothetical protein
MVTLKGQNMERTSKENNIKKEKEICMGRGSFYYSSHQFQGNT